MKENRIFNYPYPQRGINTLKATQNKLIYDGYVSIIWDEIPKAHLKAIKELVKDCQMVEVPEVKSGYCKTPAHIDYIVSKGEKRMYEKKRLVIRINTHGVTIIDLYRNGSEMPEYSFLCVLQKDIDSALRSIDNYTKGLYTTELKFI